MDSQNALTAVCFVYSPDVDRPFYFGTFCVELIADQLGHTRKSCTEEKNEPADRATVRCFNCEGEGHRVRDCPNPRPERFVCKNCKKPGHGVKECPEPRSAEGVECKKCSEIGHFSRDCPQGGGGKARICFNCGLHSQTLFKSPC